MGGGSYPSGSIGKPWRIPRMWEGETVYVLGSGPSLGLLDGSDILKDKHVIGVHDAFMIGDWIDILFMGDCRFYWENEERKKKIDDFPGLKVSCNIQVVDRWASTEGLSNIKVINIVWKRAGLLLNSSNTIFYNGGAGSAAIDFAAHLGANRIIMFGYDMRFVDGKLHYFPSNHEKPGQIDVWIMERIWRRILQDTQAANIELLNATPNSALELVPKVKLEDYL